MKTFNVNVRAMRFLTATVSVTADSAEEAERIALAHVQSENWDKEQGWSESDPEDIQSEGAEVVRG